MFLSPFSKLSTNQEKALTRTLLIAVVGCIAAIKYLDHFLVNDICTGGIISFELAGDIETATAYLNSWDEQAKIAASLGLGIDFLFPIAYASLIALLIHKLNARLWKDHAFFVVGSLLIWATFVAGLFDYIENIALINLLFGNLEQSWVSISFYFAAIKFLLVLIAILYILINFIVFLLKKVKK